jgi:hypothetical protein
MDGSLLLPTIATFFAAFRPGSIQALSCEIFVALEPRLGHCFPLSFVVFARIGLDQRPAARTTRITTACRRL